MLRPLLTTPDMWTGLADAYLAELDRIAAAEQPLVGRRHPARVMFSSDADWERSERSRNLACWNELLSGRIDQERAERLADHPAFEGPDAVLLRARAALHRGDSNAARALIGTYRAERAAFQAMLAQASSD